MSTPTCILTDADMATEDDCTTHEHEPAKPTSVTVYGVVIVEATSIDTDNARAVLSRKMGALSDLTGDLVHEASVPWAATTPAQAIAHHVGHAPDATSVSLIEREIRNAEAGVRNAIATRKAHPSYGYTKASIRADFDRLVGLGQALSIIKGLGTTDSAGKGAIEGLGIDLRALSAAVSAS